MKAAPQLALQPLNANVSIVDQAYSALKGAIMDADIYGHREEIRLDERQLSRALGVSRTPIREAMTLLEQEGYLRTVPRRGVFIVRKTKKEIIEIIEVCAALESMAARLATINASDESIGALRHMFDEFHSSAPSEHLHEYSDANIAFHQAIINLSGSQLMSQDDREPLRPRPGDSPHDDLAERSRVPLDRRSHAHHRGAGAPRHRAGRAARQAALARSGGARREILRLPRLSLAPVSALLLLFLFSLQSGQSAIVCTVTAGGAPVAGAEIVVAGKTYVTDPRGEVRIDVDPGSVELTVVKEGFAAVTATVTVGGGQQQPVTIALERRPSVQETVTVSATRTDRGLEDQPMRVEVLDREEIDEKLMMTPGDVVMMLNEMGGMRVQATSPSLGAASVRIQGMRGRYTRFLSDGLPLFGEQVSLGLMQIPPLDLGRVEVIKGVASSLYGAGAMGGVVNLVSRRPGNDAGTPAAAQPIVARRDGCRILVRRAVVRRTGA